MVFGRHVADRGDSLLRPCHSGRDQQADEHCRQQHAEDTSHADPPMISTLARGTSSRSAELHATSSTGAFEPLSRTCGSDGRAAIVPITPKYGSRMIRTGVPSARTPALTSSELWGCESRSESVIGITISGRITPARICVA